MEIFIQILGWIGTLLIIGAYYLVSRNSVDGKNRVYQLMNFFGSSLLLIHVFHQRAWPAVALQLVWMTIALYTLSHTRKKDTP